VALTTFPHRAAAVDQYLQSHCNKRIPCRFIDPAVHTLWAVPVIAMYVLFIKRYPLVCLFVVEKSSEAPCEAEKAKSVGLESKDAQN